MGGYGGMAPPAATYGYPNPGLQQPQGGYYGGMAPGGMPPAANYGGYGAAPPQQQASIGAPASGYGGAQYSPNGGRPGQSPTDPGEFPGSAPDYRGSSPGPKAYDNSAIAAGYANAAAMQMRAQQQQYSYGGATMAAAPQGYGGAAYGVYGGAQGVPPPAPGSPNGGHMPGGGGPEAAQQQAYAGDQSNYGAYRGQGPTPGRVDRSYRPY